jgi:hypothetical protein
VANQTAENYFETANAVFSGKVINVNTPVTGLIGGDDPVSVNFEVYKYWKGSPLKNILIRTGIGGGDCGYQFEEGREYLVYTFERDGVSRTNICSGTKLLAQAEGDLAILSDGSAPIDVGVNGLENELFVQFSWLTIVIILGTLLFILFLIIRSKSLPK